MTPIQQTRHSLYLDFFRKSIAFMMVMLIVLNLLDVISTVYAIGALGFVEYNPLAVGFPIWVLILKFGVCFIPMVCLYVLDKSGMENYLLLPFVFSAILTEFYVILVAFNVSSILLES